MTTIDFAAMFEAQRIHRQACTARPCRECFTDTCPRCEGDMVLGGTTRIIDGIACELRLCEACADAEERHGKIRKIEAQIPASFAWARLGAPELGKRVGATKGQLRGAYDAAVVGRSSLVITGEAGAGKTSLAVALFRAVLERGLRGDASPANLRRAQRAAFVSAYALGRERARFPLGEGEAPLVRRALSASLLVIDDLGSEPESSLSAVPDVVYERHAAGRPTWVTTWLTIEACGARYGGGIARRIFEGAHVLGLSSGQQ